MAETKWWEQTPPTGIAILVVLSERGGRITDREEGARAGGAGGKLVREVMERFPDKNFHAVKSSLSSLYQKNVIKTVRDKGNPKMIHIAELGDWKKYKPAVWEYQHQAPYSDSESELAVEVLPLEQMNGNSELVKFQRENRALQLALARVVSHLDDKTIVEILVEREMNG